MLQSDTVVQYSEILSRKRQQQLLVPDKPVFLALTVFGVVLQLLCQHEHQSPPARLQTAAGQSPPPELKLALCLSLPLELKTAVFSSTQEMMLQPHNLQAYKGKKFPPYRSPPPPSQRNGNKLSP